MNIIVKFTPDTTFLVSEKIIEKLKGETIIVDITDKNMALVKVVDGLEGYSIQELQKNSLVVYAIMENYEWKSVDQT